MIKAIKETRNKHGELHSFNDEPAVLYDNGDKDWYQNGKRHRDDGPAGESTECKAWYQNGELHRLDGPAVTSVDGYKAWYQCGKLYRLDGPAVEWSDGHKEYWIEGKKLTEEEFLERTKEKTIINIITIQDSNYYVQYVQDIITLELLQEFVNTVYPEYNARIHRDGDERWLESMGRILATQYDGQDIYSNNSNELNWYSVTEFCPKGK